MDVESVFHMTGGVGETSYAQNSSFQKKASDMVKHITTDTIQQLYITTTPVSFGIADLGCSTGPNTLSIIRETIDAVEATCREIMYPAPEFRVYLNDLPTNDFNSIFKALPEFYRELRKGRRHGGGGGGGVYIAAYPGSFYGRLFPDKCLHFVYSSYSLHWLSKVPPGVYDKEGNSINKGNIYISETSPPQLSQAYFEQFQDDFSLFLRSRAAELISGGRMVLILLGRGGANHVDRGNSFFWELLSRSLMNLASQGEIEEEKLDSYDVHFYAPSREEIENEVRREGSFQLDRAEMFEIDKDAGDGKSYGTAVANTVRAIQVPVIRRHFGEGIVDGLFEVYGKLVDEEMGLDDIKPITFLLVLRKL